MREICKKSIKIDETYTIHKRIVKLEDGSDMYQLHISTDENFYVYMSSTFTNLISATKIYNQP